MQGTASMVSGVKVTKQLRLFDFKIADEIVIPTFRWTGCHGVWARLHLCMVADEYDHTWWFDEDGRCQDWNGVGWFD
jgi:hypothetical protein